MTRLGENIWFCLGYAPPSAVVSLSISPQSLCCVLCVCPGDGTIEFPILAIQ